MRVPALKTNSIWSTRQTSSFVNDINYTSPYDNQWNNNFESLILFSKMSTQKYQKQQDQYKNAVSCFTASAKGLDTSAKALSAAGSFKQKSVSTSAGTAKTETNTITNGDSKVNAGKNNSSIVATVKSLADNYNQLNDVLHSGDNNITKRGEVLLNGVEALVGKTKRTDFASIGIAMNKNTGELQVDEKKFSDALASNPDQVQGLLTGNGSLGKAVERVTKEIANTPVSSYVKPPNLINSVNYGYSMNYGSKYGVNNWISYQNTITQGLFLNMMV